MPYFEATRTLTATCDISIDWFFRVSPANLAVLGAGYVNGTCGLLSSHLGWLSSWEFDYTSTNISGGFWSWSIKVKMTSNNGYGATNTTTITIASGTEPSSTTQKDVSGTLTGSWSGSGNADTLWDITEAADPTIIEYVTWPRDTTYRCYELSQAGSTQTSSLTLGGTTCTASGAVGALRKTANYKFSLRLDGFAEDDAGTTGTITNAKINGLVPGTATHTHTFDGQTVNNWSMTLNADPYDSAIAELVAIARLETSVAIHGVHRAWDGGYPDSRTLRITGFDHAATGYRDVTGTGSFAASDTFKDYSFVSKITTGAGVDNKTTQLMDVPPTIKTKLRVNNQDVRFPFRGWHFNGWDLTQSSLSIPGSGNDRTYTPWQGMSGFRFLDVQVKATTGTNQAGTIELTDFHGNTKRWNVVGATTTFAVVTIDLCSPDFWSVGPLPSADGKDDPYPRINTFNNTNAGAESVDSAYWGVTSCRRLRVYSGNIDIGTTTLQYTNSDSTYVPTFGEYRKERITQAIVSESDTTTTYYTRRFWQQDRDGRTEEEGDVWWQKTVGGATGVTTYSIDPVTISELAGQINATDNSVVRHPGWTATNSVAYPAGATCSVSQPPLKDCYLNGVTGYATWLYGGGILAIPDDVTGIKFLYGHKITSVAPNTIVTAQTIFDNINGDYPPDLVDPFKVNKDPDSALYLPCGLMERGIAHGAFLESDGDIQTTGQVDVLLVSDGSNRGTDSTLDAMGRYYTQSPWALNLDAHNIVAYGASIAVNPWYFPKRYRAWFHGIPPQGGCVSLDVAPNNRMCYGTIDASVVKLAFADGPNGTNYNDVTTTISGASCLHIAYDPTSPKHRLWIAVEKTGGAIEMWWTDDEGITTTMATTITAAGKNASMAINPTGKRVVAYTNGSNLHRVVYDAQGNTIAAASIIVTGGVADDKTATSWRLGRWYIVYRNTSNALIQISSVDDAQAFT